MGCRPRSLGRYRLRLAADALRAEAEDYYGERIGLQLLLHQRRKHRLGRRQHPDRSGRDQHFATHAGMPNRAQGRFVSMKARRRSCAALFACADSTDTTGTKAGIPSAGSADWPSWTA